MLAQIFFLSGKFSADDPFNSFPNSPATHLYVSTYHSRIGRDDFNLTFMIFFGELLYDVGYQKKHIRLHGRG